MNLDSSLVNRAVPPGSMRYYAWLYTPEAQRDVIAALFLIEAELHETARAPHEVAHIRLQWWYEEFDCLNAGKARHPATLALQATGRFEAIPVAERSRSVLHATAQELAKATYETDAELDQYLRNGSGNLFAMATQVVTDAPSPTVVDAAIQLGAFVRQVEIIRDLRQDFHQGQLYLPLAALDELHIEYEALHAEWPASFVIYLQSRCQQALATYQTLKHGLSSSEKQPLRPLLVLSELHARLLQTLLTDPAAHTRTRIELAPLQKLWTAWRAARLAK